MVFRAGYSSAPSNRNQVEREKKRKEEKGLRIVTMYHGKARPSSKISRRIESKISRIKKNAERV